MYDIHFVSAERAHLAVDSQGIASRLMMQIRAWLTRDCTALSMGSRDLEELGAWLGEKVENVCQRKVSSKFRSGF